MVHSTTVVRGLGAFVEIISGMYMCPQASQWRLDLERWRVKESFSIFSEGQRRVRICDCPGIELYMRYSESSKGVPALPCWHTILDDHSTTLWWGVGLDQMSILAGDWGLPEFVDPWTYIPFCIVSHFHVTSPVFLHVQWHGRISQNSLLSREKESSSMWFMLVQGRAGFSLLNEQRPEATSDIFQDLSGVMSTIFSCREALLFRHVNLGLCNFVQNSAHSLIWKQVEFLDFEAVKKGFKGWWLTRGGISKALGGVA